MSEFENRSEYFGDLPEYKVVNAKNFSIDEYKQDELKQILPSAIPVSMSHNVNSETNSVKKFNNHALFQKLGLAVNLFLQAVKNSQEEIGKISHVIQKHPDGITRIYPDQRHLDAKYFVIPGRVPVSFVIFDQRHPPQN